MDNPTSVHLGGTNLDRTVLDNLKAGSAARTFISDTLNSALTSSLANAATRAGQANLAALIAAIPPVDIAANKNMSIRDFVRKNVALPKDPAAKAAVKAAIAKLSTTSTIGELLGLNSSVQANPLFAGEVKKVQLATLLKTSPMFAANAPLIDDFIGRYAGSSGSLTDFWNILSQDPKFKAAVPELQFTLQLGTLTGDNPPLVAALRSQYPNLKTATQLASLTPAQWQQLVSGPNIPVPASVPGATPAEKASHYAASIVSILHEALPGIYFVGGLRGAIANSNDPVDRGVAKFLDNASGFDILHNNLNTSIAQNGQTLFNGVDPTEQGAVTAKLAAWQRVARVTSDFPTANSLISGGFTSAFDIASTSRASFIQQFAGPSSADAERIYGRAQQIAASAATVVSNVRLGLGQVVIKGIGDLSGELSQFLNSSTSGIPNWQTLFGSLSYCSCTDCRSVYSAAAYFVDLLHFLKKSPKNSLGYTPLDVLIGSADGKLPGRRPDLPYIKLNCENTNTTLPYVDLVNEILEGFVVLKGRLDKTVAHNTPSDVTASDLSVSPEYTNDQAYNQYLAAPSAVYPPTLPFDRWLTIARTYLGFLGSSLHQVMSICQTGALASDFTQGKPSGVAVACESLNISQAECLILTGKDFSGQPAVSPPPLYQYYGYATATTISGTPWEQDLAGEKNAAGIENLLQRTAIAYDDLVSLLETRVLNPNLSIMLQAPDSAPCDLTQTTMVDLAATGPTLQDSTFSLVHRFIRLWKKLGWAVEDLDKTMTGLRAKDIDQPFLVSLATVVQLQATLNIPLSQVLSFWGDLDTDGRDSLYLSLFQNRAVLNPPDPAFELRYVAPLAALPTLEFPSPTFPNVSYSTAFGGLLSLQGTMSDDEYHPLESLSSSTIYRTAIERLHLGLPAPLTGLPAADHLPGSPSYDAGKQQVSMVGALSDDQRGNLNFSSTPAYQTAIDALYEMRTLWGAELASATASPPQTISRHINQILAALRISTQDLGLIRTYASLNEANLSLANLSAVCRYVFLAQGLNLSIADLLSLTALIGVDPFQQQSPVATLSFVQTAQAVQASPFSIAQLNYIYRHVYDPNAGIAPQPENVALFLTTLQAGLAGIANADIVVPDPKGDLLAKNLAKLLGSPLANGAMGLINGTGLYTAPLAALPAITLPPFVTYNASAHTLSIVGAMTAAEQTQLLNLSPDPVYQGAINDLYAASQAGGTGTYTQALAALPAIAFSALPSGAITYNSAAKQLQFTGPMTSAEEATLLALSSAPMYQNAILNLREQPIDFIHANFAGFLDPSDAITQLIENPLSLTTAEKVLYVTQAFMPYLQKIQCESLIIQTLSDNLGMDPQLCSLLLKTILASQVNPGKETAMADFLALVGDGLTADYYSTKDPSGTPAMTRIDPTVNFNWGFSDFPDPSLSARPFSAKWTGWVMPQYSETYTFYVRAGDGMRLSVNGKQLLSSWVDEMPVEASGSIALTAGQLYAIKLEYYDHTASAEIGLSWSSPSTPKAIIPQSQLFSGTAIKTLDPIFRSYALLHKTSLLVDTFPLTTADVSYLYQHGQDFAGVDPSDPTKSVPFDPNLLPLDPALFKPAMFDEWERLNAVVGVRNGLPGGDAGLLAIFGTASANPAGKLTGKPDDPLTPAILQATGWNKADLLFLAGTHGYALAYADFANETGLIRLQACLALVSRLGISAHQLFEWASFGPDATGEEPIAKDMQKTVKSKYDDDTWVTVGKPLNDAIREASKEALIAYILAHSAEWNLASPEGGPITTSDQLYEFFLIDVDMSPCMLTSRIVQANAAIQLFVQRCLLNLESSPSNPAMAVSPSAIDNIFWNWMQNYRVWEANREVLLYPENWMVPSLRDDKTPFFEDLENALLQGPVTADNAEQAYLNYLGQLEEVARLDIRATYWNYDANAKSSPNGTEDATNDVLHVFGRTASQPYSYYYRNLQNCHRFKQGGGGTWTPWELVDLDIAGDHLVPVVWDGRLYLFWPIIQETADPSSSSQPPMKVPPIHVITAKEAKEKVTPPPPMPAPTPDPVKDLQITLAWSEYRQGSWSAKSLSDPLIFKKYSTGTVDTSVFSFSPELNGNSLDINVYDNSRESLGLYTMKIGQFSFSKCGSSPTRTTRPKSHVSGTPVIPLDSYFSYNSVRQDSGGKGLTFEIGMRPTDQYPSVPGSYRDPEGITDYPPILSLKILGKSPSRWDLSFPLQFFDSYGLEVQAPFTNQPAFYQDSDRVYFITESFAKPSDSLANANLESPIYNRGVFTGITPVANTNIVFPGVAGLANNPSPVLGASASAAGLVTDPPPVVGIVAGPPTKVSSKGGKQAAGGQISLSQVVFTNFFHPFSCHFIKKVNQYGLPGFLTLFEQASTNDHGVISGFVSPYSSWSWPKLDLSPGILITHNAGQSQLYETKADSYLDPPPSGTSYLYFNSLKEVAGAQVSTRRFYYSLKSKAETNGDAFLGTNDTTGYARSFKGSTVFELDYAPNHNVISNDTYPLENVDFSTNGAYSIYNWELFFHIPLLIATSLSQNQQFSDAQTWFNYIFNPTSSSPDPIPQRYWNCLPFYECAPWDEIQGQIQNLLFPPSNGQASAPPCLCGQSITDQINKWMKNPFEPFLIGRMRTVAFRMKVVMAYLDNLIAWGDSLFTQNTRESINEATQVYMLAKEILGDRPVQIPQRGNVQDYTYNDLVNFFGIDSLSNAMVLMENDFPYLSTSDASGSSGLGSAISMSSSVPYFCVPPNDILLGYWDTVDDRLYKIRNCMNIQGQVEQLPLFSPPISPALLVAATAAGVDLSSVLSNINAGPPFYRFKAMVQRALELCSAVQSMGAALLSALEKRDAEALALLRATQEGNLLQAMQQIKESAVQAAQADIGALQASLQVATDRQLYYNALISGNLNANEQQQLTQLADSLSALENSKTAQMAAEGLHFIPSVQTGGSGWGGSPYVAATIFSVEAAIAIATATGTYYSIDASQDATSANIQSVQGQWNRRFQEWGFQLQSATDEVAQINAQIGAAKIRLTMAQQDQGNLNLEIQNAQAVQNFLSGKYTNIQLYSWMIDQISTVFFQCYQMAYDLATQAEAAFRFERGLANSSYIQFGYWDSLKKGLLSGERLYADLKRMETAYLETDLREYEISKPISLLLFDPWALIALKETGACVVSLSEALFDLDYPGHYFRRIKTVSLAIPCVTGPYTSVNCTLTLLNSKVRVDNTASSKADYASDAHFITNYAATQSIATSTAQNDSGLFEVNFQDERYLPFEGAGAISTWRIELPQDCNAFDFESISDVVLNLKYTSRYGGDNLRGFARQAASLPTPPTQPAAPTNPSFPAQDNLRRLFSLKHEFSAEWYKFLNPPTSTPNPSMQIALGTERFPFQYRQKKIQISEVELFLVFKSEQSQEDYLKTSHWLALGLGAPGISKTPTATLTSNANFLGGMAYGIIAQPPQPATSAPGSPPTWMLSANSADIANVAPNLQDILILCHYSAS